MQATSNSGPPSQDLQQENDLHKDALPGLTPQNSANLPQFTGSKRILGCLSERHYLRPEDPTPNGQKEYAQWQDPFRMSVLDFQHRALDKLAEVLSIYLKANGMIIDPKEHEDVNALLGYIQLNAEGFAQELETNNPNKLTLETMCETLRSARNAFAHQKYNKSLQSEENKCQKPLPPEYKTTRTFEHTTDVIDYCIDLTERVVEVISREKKRELRIRQSDLQRLKHSFEDFSEYRVGEKRSIETFSKYLNNHEVMKKVAKEVLAELASRIEKDDADDSDDSQDLCKFLACIVAPRCSFLPASADKDLAMLAAQLDARLTIVSKERDTSS